MGQRDAAERNAQEILSGLDGQTRDLLGSMESLAGSLSSDLAGVQAGLGAVQEALESGLGHLAGALAEGFGAIVRQQATLQAALKRLIEIAETPEHTKALENFRHALYSVQRELWDEAGEYLDAAITGDQYSKGYKLDWHFHWVRGQLLARPRATTGVG